MSRSAFVDRFTTLIGMPPIRYLTLWRLQAARRNLRETRKTIGQLAHEVGYGSEEHSAGHSSGSSGCHRAVARTAATRPTKSPASRRPFVHVLLSPSAQAFVLDGGIVALRRHPRRPRHHAVATASPSGLGAAAECGEAGSVRPTASVSVECCTTAISRERRSSAASWGWRSLWGTARAATGAMRESRTTSRSRASDLARVDLDCVPGRGATCSEITLDPGAAFSVSSARLTSKGSDSLRIDIGDLGGRHAPFILS